MWLTAVFTRTALLPMSAVLPLLCLATWFVCVSHAQGTVHEGPGALGTNSISAPWNLAPLAPSLYHTNDVAPRLHVVVMSVPLWGHFKPLWAIAEDMAYRGHTVTCVVERAAWCETLLRHSKHVFPLVLENVSAAAYAEASVDGRGPLDIQCVIVPQHKELFTRDTLQAITDVNMPILMTFCALFHDLFKHHELALPGYLRLAKAIHSSRPITTLLCDITTYACASVGRKMDLSVVNGFPFTAQLTVGLQPMLPAVGLGFPRRMSLRNRIVNFAFKMAVAASESSALRRLNRIRYSNGVPPLRDGYDAAGMYGPIIAPILWGLDIPQPLCPNIHQVGPLNTRDQRQPYRREDLSADLADFMDGCSQGVIYVNWGTLGLPAPEVEDCLQDALLEAAPLCVVWKRLAAPTKPLPPAARFYVTSWLSSTTAVLKHPNTRMFFTHCGDTSVLESVEAGVPLVGFPLFADHADVCQRVKEAGIGVPASETKSFTRAGVAAAVASVDKNYEAMVRRLHKLRTIAAAYGGPRRAADIIESRQYNLLIHRNTTLERCTTLSGPLQVSYILLTWVAVLVVGGLLWMCALRRVCQLCLPMTAAWWMLQRTTCSATRRHTACTEASRVHAVPRSYRRL